MGGGSGSYGKEWAFVLHYPGAGRWVPPRAEGSRRRGLPARLVRGGVSATLVKGERKRRLPNWMPLEERLMLSVVRTEASSRPEICIASLAGIRGDFLRSRPGFVMWLSFSALELARSGDETRR